MNLITFLAAFLGFISIVYCEITVLKNVQVIYDRSPKLRIIGDGFLPVEDLEFTLSSSGENILKQDIDFFVSNATDNGITFRLLPQKKWVDLSGRVPPVSLVLERVVFKDTPTKNLLYQSNSINIANVLESPSIVQNDDTLYATASNELRINGTGFEGAKKVDLYFQPPLRKEIDYEIVSKFPIRTDEVVLRLKHGSAWRDEPGPLSVLALDTGGGPVSVGNVTVAYVEDNLDSHSVSVQDTSKEQLIYHDEASVIIKGTGFSTEVNRLSFANGLLGKGINYTTTSSTTNELHLSLVSGSFWRKNVENLPNFLTLLAVDAGGGFVAVGPVNAGKGRDVATVFERPTITDLSGTAAPQLFRTHTHTWTLKGTGFPQVLSEPLIIFEPKLVEDVDYTATVESRTEITITLLTGKAWRTEPGPLLVMGINTRGDAAGWVNYKDGIKVADVIADTASDVTGGIEVFPSSDKVYQSCLSESIDIFGRQFSDDLSFTFNSKIEKYKDYMMDKISSPNKITLRLIAGKQWTQEAGPLVLISASKGGAVYPFAQGQGIRVADVLADPQVTTSSDSLHSSQSKIVSIEGTGFTTVEDTRVLLFPTLPNAYKVASVLDNKIRIQLLPGQTWLPPYLSLTSADAGKSIPLQVVSMDSGAGSIKFDAPIIIGTIVKDRAGEVCDDSCEFAFDDVCDDGTESEEYAGTYYAGDDLGGTEAETEYYAVDDEYVVSACLQGTDCTDCGGIDAVVDYNAPPDETDKEAVVCTNDCIYAHDNVCDDPRSLNYCALGTDCFDCGPVGASNFTIVDEGAWDDDDDYWKFNDAAFMDQTQGLQQSRRGKIMEQSSDPVPTSQYLDAILLGIAYTVGLTVATSVLVYGTLKLCGYNTDALLRTMFNFGEGHSDIELGTTQRMQITPSTFTTGA